MSTAALASAHPGVRVRPAAGPWVVLRAALVACWVLLALLAVGTGQRPASTGDLRAAVGSGRVHVVHVTGGLPAADAGGHALQEVVWRQGALTRRTEVWQVGAGATAPDRTRPVVTTDLVGSLRAERPGLRVVREEPARSSSELAGWRVPAWLGLAAVLELLAAWWLLVNGPAPERATRWAWFWLSASPVGVLALLLLSGPLRGLPAPRPGARRLTGGWAFLLSCLLGVSVLGSAT